MMIQLFNQDNKTWLENNWDYKYKFNVIYSDVIYESTEFSWAYNLPLVENGIFILQTDYHTVADWYKFLSEDCGYTFVNWCIYINDWGGVPKKGFPNKHDDILIFCNGKDFYWDSSEIQIPKVTAGTAFDKKGTGLKTPPDVFYDHASFSTMAKERVKTADGHLIQWQKPMWLMDRLIRPFTKEGDFVLDTHMGSGTLGVWCKQNNRNYFGVENNKEVFEIAEKRIEQS